jgi:DNA-binding NarL/FixJ family response regulator
LCRLLTLEFPDYVFVEAEAGLQAFAEMHALTPSLVLLDLAMPRSSGYTVFKAIQATWPDLPVVLMSVGDPHRGYDLFAKHLGAAAYIEKTDAPERLTEVVRQALRLSTTPVCEATALPEP